MYSFTFETGFPLGLKPILEGQKFRITVERTMQHGLQSHYNVLESVMVVHPGQLSECVCSPNVTGILECPPVFHYGETTSTDVSTLVVPLQFDGDDEGDAGDGDDLCLRDCGSGLDAVDEDWGWSNLGSYAGLRSGCWPG